MYLIYYICILYIMCILYLYILYVSLIYLYHICIYYINIHIHEMCVRWYIIRKLGSGGRVAIGLGGLWSDHMLSCMKLLSGFDPILVVAAQPAPVLVWVYRIYIKNEGVQRRKPVKKIIPSSFLYYFSLSLYLQFSSSGFIKDYLAC